MSIEWRDDVRPALARQHNDLAAMLRECSDDDWSRPSACPGWSVADVVLHLAQTDEMAIASVDGELALRAGAFSGDTVDAAADAAVAFERGLTGAPLFDRWKTSATTLRERFATAAASARVQWVAGTLAAQTLATTRLAECWIHTGDVAAALDATVASDDRLRHIARLAWRTVPYAFARADRSLTGPVAFVLTGPGDERWEFGLEDAPATIVRGTALDLCRVAGQRAAANDSTLHAEGPDADAVLELVRTFA